MKCNYVDETIFDELNEENLYWLGILATDGNVFYPKKSSQSPKFSLHSKDLEHIEKFKSFTKSPNKILYSRGCYSISISSKVVCDKLVSYGITPRKSFTLSVDSKLRNSRDFWRGVIDGDGYISKSRRPVISLISASEEFIKQFIIYVKIIDPSISGKCCLYRNYFRMQVYDKKASNIIRHLYENVNVSLDRKMINAVKMINFYQE